MLPFRSPQITIVAQCFDANGVIRCPVDESGYFGITVSMAHDISAFEFVKKTLNNRLNEFLPEDSIECISLVEPSFSREGLDPTMLYLVKIASSSLKAPTEWPTFLSYLKKLSSSAERVAYNKAFQFFAGSHLDEVNVLEVDEAVRKALESLIAVKE